MNSQQKPDGCVFFSFGVLVIMALIGFLAVVGAAGGGGGGVTDSNNTTHVLSDNNVRILSPDTNVYINSNNAPTNVTGDRNVITSPYDGAQLCWDAALNTYTSSACGGQP